MLKTHMPITNAVRTIQRLSALSENLSNKYKTKPDIVAELDKLNAKLQDLLAYLNNIENLKPNLKTDEINTYMEAIILHLDILKEQIDKDDYAKLQKGMNVVKSILHFHRHKYSAIGFIGAWLLELSYFV